MPLDTAAVISASIRAVARYVRANPLGSDTPEGIARWWLDDETLPIAHVKSALDWMTEHRLLEVVTAADGRLRYRRIASDAQLDAALELLTGAAASGRLP
jgi:hypothetical protein